MLTKFISLLCSLGLIISVCFKERDNVNSSKDCTTRSITSQELAAEYGEQEPTISQYTCCLAIASGGVVKYCYPFPNSSINSLNNGDLDEGNSIDCSGNGKLTNFSNSFKLSLLLIFIFLFLI